MARKLTKTRPPQGARLAELRKAAHLSQAALGRLIGEKQQNIAFWELSDKPPRSDVLPKLAHVLGISVEQLLDVNKPIERKNGPVRKVRRLFEEVSELPRGQQEKVVEFVSALVESTRQGELKERNAMKRGSSLAEIEELTAQLPAPEQLKLAARICERLSMTEKTQKEVRREQLAWLRQCDRIAAQIPGKFDTTRVLREIRNERS